LEELRAYAMALHTREQAPREGKAASQKPQQAVRYVLDFKATNIILIQPKLNLNQFSV